MSGLAFSSGFLCMSPLAFVLSLAVAFGPTARADEPNPSPRDDPPMAQPIDSPAATPAPESLKPIRVRAVFPAFAYVGDRLILRATVEATTDFGGRAELFIDVGRSARAEKGSELFSIAAHESKAIDIPVEVVASGSTRWRWAVKFVATDGAAESWDEVQTNLMIEDPRASFRRVESMHVESERTELFRLSDPSEAPRGGEITVSLTNTRVGALAEAVRQLLASPFAGVEQMTSRILPWLSVRDLRATLPELAKPDAEINDAVNNGIRALLALQQSSGGLSFWPGEDQASFWGSAYASLALTMAKKQGFDVAEAAHERLLTYLHDQLRGSEEPAGADLSARCLAAYALALAGTPDAGSQTALFRKRAELSMDDRALLAMAVLETKGSRHIVEQLLERTPAKDSATRLWFESEARTNALQLLAWSLRDRSAKRTDELAKELLAQRQNGHWTTTQANIWAVIALASYLRNVEAAAPASAGTVAWGETKKSFALSNVAPLARNAFPLEPANAEAPITLTKTGGPMFAEVILSAPQPTLDQPKEEHGFSIARRYERIGDDGRLVPAEDLRPGERVVVTLDVDARQDAAFVAVQDPIPSILMPLDQPFTAEDPEQATPAEARVNYRELRRDRGVFYTQEMLSGHSVLRYVARVIGAGDAVAPSARVEEIYRPENFGTTGTQRLSATAPASAEAQ